jgi:hypothetical protein
MGIESLKDVYDPIAKKTNAIGQQEQQQSLPDWKDSAPVVRLSEYLKENPDQGIRLILSDGQPALRFEPGLTKVITEKDKDRWQVATNCIELLFDALADLKQLISTGRIKLPDLSNQ